MMINKSRKSLNFSSRKELQRLLLKIRLKLQLLKSSNKSSNKLWKSNSKLRLPQSSKNSKFNKKLRSTILSNSRHKLKPRLNFKKPQLPPPPLAPNKLSLMSLTQTRLLPSLQLQTNSCQMFPK